MKVVNSGNTYQIYDDTLRTYDQLPPQTYVVRFSQAYGFLLELNEDIKVDEKIYGVHMQKVDKVMRSFNEFNRNLGVILSGAKGIGKSVCAKLIAERAVAEGYPVIKVTEYVKGIANFLSEIKQEVVIVFDEFDKTFASKRHGNDDDVTDAQAELLTLLDGMEQGKKLFIVTCNSLDKLNEFMVNRPGRFHYHFRFGYPNPAEIREYMQDKLDMKFWGEIDKVINFSSKVDLNYDCLRSIAWELSHGYSFESSIQDLNIINIERERYKIQVVFSDGTKTQTREQYLDLFDSDSEVEVELKYMNKGSVYVTFNPIHGNYNTTLGATVVDGSKVKDVQWYLYNDDNDIDDDDTEIEKAKKREESAENERIKALHVEYIVITRKYDKNIHYMV